MSKQIYIPELVAIGSQLQKIRKDRNIAIFEITFKTGLSNTDITDIENVDSLYPIHHLLLYADALNLKLTLAPA